MTTNSSLESTTVTERLVLHELAGLEAEGRTPARATDVLGSCRGRLADLEDVVGGRLSEADVVGACRTLADKGLVTEQTPDATSPVGKGRPAYELAVDAAIVRESLAEDDRFHRLSD